VIDLAPLLSYLQQLGLSLPFETAVKLSELDGEVRIHRAQIPYAVLHVSGAMPAAPYPPGIYAGVQDHELLLDLSQGVDGPAYYGERWTTIEDRITGLVRDARFRGAWSPHHAFALWMADRSKIKGPTSPARISRLLTRIENYGVKIEDAFAAQRYLLRKAGIHE